MEVVNKIQQNYCNYNGFVVNLYYVIFGQTKKEGRYMQLNAIVSPTIKELFVKEVETQILSGALAVGEKLPPEREMAEKMKISRTTVNEGLAELERKGFIEIVPRKGNFVADYLRNGNLQTLMAMLNFNGGNFKIEVFQSMMDFRRNVESEGAYLAAVHHSEEDIEYLYSVCDAIETAADIEEASQIMYRWHHGILCATGNYIYPLIFNAFKDIILVCSRTVFTAFGVSTAKESTREIIDAIAAGDAETARTLMYNLITGRMDNLNAQRPKFI